jgi:hypothetical protein
MIFIFAGVIIAAMVNIQAQTVWLKRTSPTIGPTKSGKP